MHRTITLSCTIALAAVSTALAGNPNFSITRSVIATGGGTSSGGAFAVTGTVGETCAGNQLAYGAQFDLASGYWAERPAVMWPLLEPIIPTTFPPAGYTMGVRWAPSRDAWKVEYSFDLIQWLPSTSPTFSSAFGMNTISYVTPMPRHAYWRLVRLPQP